MDLSRSMLAAQCPTMIIRRKKKKIKETEEIAQEGNSRFVATNDFAD